MSALRANLGISSIFDSPMPKTLKLPKIFIALCVAILTLFSGSAGVLVQAEVPGPLPKIPWVISGTGGKTGIVANPSGEEVISIIADGIPRKTTINSKLQGHLTQFLKNKHSPIAAVVVVDVKTGKILAMAQGAKPHLWGGNSHTALHNGFPAASLFKTVVTTAAFEIADIDASEPIGLYGGCQNVRATGVWLKDKITGHLNRMTLRRAFGQSCNGFFAKIAVNHLGLGIITNFAQRFGWKTGVPTDFHLEKSPFRPPLPHNSSTHTVGRYAAGFGYVGISAVHAAWIMLTIANNGAPVPIKIFKDSPTPDSRSLEYRMFSSSTTRHLIDIMDSTIRGGTASFAFRRGKYRKLRHLVGGKTGTLTGRSPKGLTTWFAGMMPLEAPEIVVAAVVVLEDRWHIKGPHLAAEAFWAYYDLKLHQDPTISAHYLPLK